MIFKRTLILNDINNRSSSKKGVLNLEDVNNQLVGTLRLYNIDDYEVKKSAIGLSAGREVLKIPVNFQDGVCHFKTQNNLNLQDRLSCALVDISEIASPHILIGGTSTYLQEWATRVEQAFYQDELPLNKEEMYSLGEDEEIENAVTQTLEDDKEYQDCSHCSKCKYREAFYHEQPDQKDMEQNNFEQQPQVDVLKKVESPQEPSKQQENIEPVPNIEPDLCTSSSQTMQEAKFINLKSDEEIDDDKNFYEQVKSQIDELFEQYEPEQTLQDLLPNSKWVRVRYENSENFYVLGLIYEDNQIKYISYGLPADNPKTPPRDLQEYAQWLPIDTNNPDGKGYWLVYQSAESGESILVEVI